MRFIDPSDLHIYFNYNPETGVVGRNKITPQQMLGNYKSEKTRDTASRSYNMVIKERPNGSIDLSTGYMQVIFFGKKMYLHRIAYALHHGVWPEQVDHINGNKLDNRAENLRCVCQVENSRNQGLRKGNTSGYIGVTYNKANKNWLAQITVRGKNHYIGSFISKESARKARKEAEKNFGFHENHGSRPCA